MIRKIKKAKLDYNTRYLDVEFDEIDDEGNVDHNKRESEGRRRMVHDDLIAVFNALSLHLAAQCEQYLMPELLQSKAYQEKFVLTGYVLGGKDEHEGVTLLGHRKLDGGMLLHLVAPFTKFHPDHTGYSYVKELEILLQQAFREIDQYLSRTKFAPEPQLEIFNDDEKPKSGKRKKTEDEEVAA